MWIIWNGTVIQGGMPRVAVDLTEIICRGESNKRNKQIKYRYYNIHVDIFVSLSGSVIILISSIESNMSTKYIKGNWNIIELISAW